MAGVLWPLVIMAQQDITIRVAVLPFDIFSMEETPNLGREVSIQLSQQIALNPRLLTCNYTLVESLLKDQKGHGLDQQRLKEIAQALEAQFVVTGSLTKIQNDMSMDVQVFNTFDKEAYFKTFAEGTSLQALIRDSANKIEQDVIKKAALMPPAQRIKGEETARLEIPEERPAEAKGAEKPVKEEAPPREEKKPGPAVTPPPPPAPEEKEFEEEAVEQAPAAPAKQEKAEVAKPATDKEQIKTKEKKEASTGKKEGPSLGSNLPVNINSDTLEYDNKKSSVAFNGHVVARQGDMVIFADSMKVEYEAQGKLKQMEAQGGVKIIQGDRIATGDKITFYNEQQKIVLTGNPRVWQGDNVIHGEKITVFIKDERSIVEGSLENRVSATIVPKKKEQKGSAQKESR